MQATTIYTKNLDMFARENGFFLLLGSLSHSPETEADEEVNFFTRGLKL